MIASPAPAPQRRSLMKKQIPTLLGLVVLIAGLAIGAFLFSEGTGIFLPRATPETTPKSIRLSNLTDQGFSVTFVTDAATSGFIRYGKDPDKLTQVGDQRDQLTGTVGEYTLHQISVLRGLEANTTYYYVLGTGNGALFDDNGEPFTIKTAKKAGTQPQAMTVFGSVVTRSGAPAAGAVVFVTPPGAGTMSSLVTNTGSWAISLSNARKTDGSDYAPVAIGDLLSIQVAAVNPSENTQLTAPVEAETAIAIKLGTDQADVSETTPTEVTAEEVVTPSPTASPTATPTATPTAATQSANLADISELLDETEVLPPTTPVATLSGVLELAEADPATGSTPPVVETSTPVITGTALPNVTVTIVVNSETQLDAQVVADENGNFELDISQYQKELEPGDHSITYSYVDPNTGVTVTKTREFTVAPRATLAAAATPTPAPYSTTNPYPIGTSSATGTNTTSTTSGTVTPRPTATPRPSSSSTSSSYQSTQSGLPASGSVGATLLLIIGGFFFLISGIWSWWISRELAEEYAE